MREAINAANADQVTSTIAFNIPTSDPGFNATTTAFTIRPTSSLPTITAPVIIDGYTQPGATPNTNGPGLGLNTVLMIELDGTNAGALADGLIITSGGSTVRGLVINRFSGYGIYLSGFFSAGGGNLIEGNFIGTDITGRADLGNSSDGIHILTPSNNIGGTTADGSNVISGNGRHGVFINGPAAAGNLVQGNFIGTDVNGGTAVGNLGGVHIFNGLNNIIGGTTANARNVISGNKSGGVSIFGSASFGAMGNLVQGNFIGTDVSGATAVGNTGHGVLLSFSSSTKNNTVGGAASSAGNVIAFNGSGVFVAQGTGNAILSNFIFSNGGLGIDLGTFGPTPNDPGDGDVGANNLQNFPVVTSAEISVSGDLVVQFSVDSATGNSAYPLHVEFFMADADGQEGKTFLGSDSYPVSTAQSSKASSLGNTAALGVGGGDVIVATATDANNNTSEFSQGVEVTAVATPIPGASHWGLIAMAGLMAALLLWQRRRVVSRDRA